MCRGAMDMSIALSSIQLMHAKEFALACIAFSADMSAYLLDT